MNDEDRNIQPFPMEVKPINTIGLFQDAFTLFFIKVRNRLNGNTKRIIELERRVKELEDGV